MGWSVGRALKGALAGTYRATASARNPDTGKVEQKETTGHASKAEAENEARRLEREIRGY